jgi:Tfp pilus assembly protein FimT
MSLMELLTVMALLGIIAAIALPKMGKIFEGIGVRSAKHEIAAYLASARAIAIQNGGTTTFERTGNSLRVTLDIPGTPTQVVMRPKDLHSEYGVTLSGLEAMRYNGRGFASGLTENIGIIGVERAGKRDSVCVMGRGKIMSSECSL